MFWLGKTLFASRANDFDAEGNFADTFVSFFIFATAEERREESGAKARIAVFFPLRGLSFLVLFDLGNYRFNWFSIYTIFV